MVNCQTPFKFWICFHHFIFCCFHVISDPSVPLMSKFFQVLLPLWHPHPFCHNYIPYLYWPICLHWVPLTVDLKSLEWWQCQKFRWSTISPVTSFIFYWNFTSSIITASLVHFHLGCIVSFVDCQFLQSGMWICHWETRRQHSCVLAVQASISAGICQWQTLNTVTWLATDNDGRLCS